MPQSRLRPPWLVLTALALLANAVALFRPAADGTMPFPQADKVVHVLLFAVPGLFGLLARLPMPQWLGLLAVYAALSEVIQRTLIPSRDGSMADLLADLIGLALAALLARALLTRAPLTPAGRRHTRE